MTALAGVFPVISTPFTNADEIDTGVLRREIDWLIDCDVDGLTIAMVSEVLRLSEGERKTLAELTVSHADGRVPVITSVGAETTRAAITYATHAQEIGAAAVMAISPMAVSLPDDKIAHYFRSIIDSIDIPVVVQDASGYLGRALPISLYVDLIDQYGPDRVLVKPEASPIGPRLSALRDASGGRARVFEGTGGLMLVDSFARGIVGTMPGAEMPWALVALWRAMTSGDEHRVARIHGVIAALVSLQTSLDSFVAVEKHMLVQQGIFANMNRREPVGYELDHETAAHVDRLTDQLRAACELN
jgi:4-hydroxy-tetrahydrodipicolinate synthase